MSVAFQRNQINSFQASRHVPNDMLLKQGIELRKLYEASRLELFQFVELEKTLSRLTNSMGGCERIRNTMFPTTYSRVVHGLIYVFVFFLPFGLVDVPAVGLVVTSLLLSFAFLMIDDVGPACLLGGNRLLLFPDEFAITICGE